MVHIALKRKRSSESLVNETRPTEIWEQETDPGESIRSSQEGSQTSDTPNKPDARYRLLGLLEFLSDVELYDLVTDRIGKAIPEKPPLNLSNSLIEGIHNFFRPQTENTPFFDKLVETGQTMSPDSGPFSKVILTRRELFRMTGKTMDSYCQRDVAERSSQLLVSLATLFSFLNPSELRRIVNQRIEASQPPHRNIDHVVDFLRSSGERKMQSPRTRGKRPNPKEGKLSEFGRGVIDLNHMSTGVLEKDPQDGEALRMAGKVSAGSCNPTDKSCISVDMEDGEVDLFLPEHHLPTKPEDSKSAPLVADLPAIDALATKKTSSKRKRGRGKPKNTVVVKQESQPKKTTLPSKSEEAPPMSNVVPSVNFYFAPVPGPAPLYLSLGQPLHSFSSQGASIAYPYPPIPESMTLSTGQPPDHHTRSFIYSRPY